MIFSQCNKKIIPCSWRTQSVPFLIQNYRLISSIISVTKPCLFTGRAPCLFFEFRVNLGHNFKGFFCLPPISATQENLEYTERKQTLIKLHDPSSWALRKSVDFDPDDTGQITENCDRQSLNKSFLRDLSTNSFASLDLLLLRDWL